MSVFRRSKNDDDAPESDEAEVPVEDDEAIHADDAPLVEAGHDEPDADEAAAKRLEDDLKDLAARMAVLTSNVDGVRDARGQMEDKLKTVEQRMLRLSALAEAVSSRYNPFIAENAPTDPSWESAPEPVAAEDTPGATGPEPPSPETAAEAPDDGAPAPHPRDGHDGPSELSATRPVPDDRHDPASAGHPDRPVPTRVLALDVSGAGRGPDPLEHNLLLLEWVGMMLRRVGRAGLLDLMDYYEGLGWLDADTKARALRVAVGFDAPDRVGEGSWRGDLELHARSLVAIERLDGNTVPAARLDELRLDLGRLFRE